MRSRHLFAASPASFANGNSSVMHAETRLGIFRFGEMHGVINTASQPSKGGFFPSRPTLQPGHPNFTTLLLLRRVSA